jgi:hypothetical protein
MPLLDNIAGVAFETEYPVDKIVGVWEGSFNQTTQVTSRSATFGGSPNTAYFYRIAHGFPRPVFVDLLWSSDNVTWYDGGVNGHIAFSDSTYIYVYSSQGSTVAGTLYYKVIAFWIDNFDIDDPLVPGYESPNKSINFDSRLNYQKLYAWGKTTFASASTKLLTHDLNKRANFRVFFESFADEVWPLHFGGASDVFLYDDAQTECYAHMKNTALEVSLFNVPSSRRLWYRIYLDT